MLIVLDTSVIIAQLLTRKKTYTNAIFDLAKSKKIELALSDETLYELKKSVSDLKIKNQVNYSSRIVAVFTAWYQYNSFIYKPHTTTTPKLLRDPKDNIFLQLAIASRATYLISVDKDLLILKSIGSTHIVTPKEFIIAEFPQLVRSK